MRKPSKESLFLDKVLENIPHMIFVKDAKDLRFVLFNKAGEALLGYSKEELIGKNDYDFFPKDQADHFTATDRETLESRRMLVMPEAPIRTRYRGERILRSKKIPILDSRGEPVYLLGISEDITEEKKAAEEHEILIRAQAARIEAEATALRFARLARAGETLAKSLDYNQTLESFANLLVPDLADFCLIDVTSKNRRPERVLSRGFDPGSPALVKSQLVLPLIARRRALGKVTLGITSERSPYDGLNSNLITDLVHRAALAIDNAILYAESQKAIQLRDEFLAIASHELKTPLTPLRLQTQILLRWSREKCAMAPNGHSFAELLQDSDRQIKRLSMLIETVLDMSRIQDGTLSLNREKTDLVDLVRTVITHFSHQLAAGKCAILLEADQPVFGLWDSIRLEELIVNLLTNAMKYGKGKPIKIRVRETQGKAFLEVQDQGIGIATKDRERIFERFERAVSLREFGGLGIGLYIAHQIALAHGGNIRISSKLGKGSTFVVELPLAPAAEQGTAA